MRACRFMGLAIAAWLTATVGLAGSAPAQPAASPWTTITLGDLDVMHRTIVDTHPGMVDDLNPEFRQWTEDGYRQAQARAASVRNFYDYARVMRFYANGFKDNHVEMRFNVDSTRRQWPGFLPVAADNQLRVTLSQVEEVPVGAVIRSCDGTPAWQLLEQRVLPYRYNPRVRPLLERMGAQLFFVDAADPAAQIRQCDFEVNGQTRQVDLVWRAVTADDSARLQREALGWVTPPLALRKLNGFWFVTMSTFQINSPEQVAAYRRFLAELEANRETLRREPLVLDLRGVPGGVSLWGREVLKTIWGEDWIAHVESGARNFVDWRASEGVIPLHEGVVAQLESNGFPDDARFYRDLVARIRTAIRQGQPYVRTGEAAGQRTPRPRVNPVHGPVFMLTDGICASACLDFVDIAIRLPGVRHVGLPTAADTTYLENRFWELPSGLARLTSSTKVLRDRARRANEYYEPSVRWPGGLMTDEAVARWIAGLTP